MTAAIDGGDGEDELVLTGVTVRDTTYQLAMNNVETLTVANSTKILHCPAKISTVLKR